MRTRFVCIILLVCVLAGAKAQETETATNPVDWVNPIMGTDS